MADPVADRAERWPVVSSADLHRDEWVMALRVDRIRPPHAPEAEPFARLVLEHPGAAVTLALDSQRRVLCLLQYRHAAGRRFVELPAGLLDVAGEPPLAVAQRELREEAGLAAQHWTRLLSVHASPGISNEVFHIFVAQGLSSVDRGEFVLEHEEADMELVWVPFDDLLEAVLEGRVSNAPVALAVLACQASGLATETVTAE